MTHPHTRPLPKSNPSCACAAAAAAAAVAAHSDNDAHCPLLGHQFAQMKTSRAESIGHRPKAVKQIPSNCILDTGSKLEVEFKMLISSSFLLFFRN